MIFLGLLHLTLLYLGAMEVVALQENKAATLGAGPGDRAATLRAGPGGLAATLRAGPGGRAAILDALLGGRAATLRAGPGGIAAALGAGPGGRAATLGAVPGGRAATLGSGPGSRAATLGSGPGGRADTLGVRPGGRAVSDPWTSVTKIPGEGAASSKLFNECIKSSREVEYKPSAVVSPSTGSTYWRYEVSSFRSGDQPETWDDELVVEDIFDCADAAADYRLFKLEANKCMLSNETYGTMYPYEFGEPEGNKEVLYVNYEKPRSVCFGNGEIYDESSGRCMYAITLNGFPLEAFVLLLYKLSVCSAYGAELYFETDALPFSKLQSYLRSNQITGEFLVGAVKSSFHYQWYETGIEVDPSIFVQSSSMEKTDNQIMAVISSEHDYKLLMKDWDYNVLGTICFNPPNMVVGKV